MTQELKDFIKKRDQALIALDLDWARELLSRPKADEQTLLIALHKARLGSKGVPESYKKESRQWLKELGYQDVFIGDVFNRS